MDQNTKNEIEKYWGSVEAYYEEQRRCAVYNLEMLEADQPGSSDRRQARNNNSGATAVNNNGKIRFRFGFLGNRA
jgi:hypothetical protein